MADLHPQIVPIAPLYISVWKSINLVAYRLYESFAYETYV